MKRRNQKRKMKRTDIPECLSPNATASIWSGEDRGRRQSDRPPLPPPLQPLLPEPLVPIYAITTNSSSLIKWRKKKFIFFFFLANAYLKYRTGGTYSYHFPTKIKCFHQNRRRRIEQLKIKGKHCYRLYYNTQCVCNPKGINDDERSIYKMGKNQSVRSSRSRLWWWCSLPR